MKLRSQESPAIITPRKISDRISEIVNSSELGYVLKEIRAHLPKPVHPFIVGGYLRDKILFSDRQINDVDIMVFNAEDDEVLENWLSPFIERKTTFGGLELTIDEVSVDIWRAEQQAMISGEKIHNIEYPEAFEYITLTINSIASSFDGKYVYGSDFLRSVVDKTLRLGRKSKWLSKWRPYHLAHLAYTHSLTSYSIGDRAAFEILRTSKRDRSVAIKYLKDRKGKPSAPKIVWSTIKSAHTSFK